MQSRSVRRVNGLRVACANCLVTAALDIAPLVLFRGPDGLREDELEYREIVQRPATATPVRIIISISSGSCERLMASSLVINRRLYRLNSD